MLRDRSAPEERTGPRGPWVCQALKAPSACRSQEKQAVLDPRESTVTLAYRGRKVLLVLVVLWAPWDRLESGGLQGRKGQLDPEAPRGPWDPQDPLELQVEQENQETLELLVLRAPSA